VTRQVPLALEVGGFTRDPEGGTRAGFSATAQLDRKDFGIATSPLVGSLLAGDRVQVFIQIRAVLTAPQPADA
jgi:polyisoprenoid-binding protein YceI